MGVSGAMEGLRRDAARFLKSPANVALLALVVTGGVVMGPLSVAVDLGRFRAATDWSMAGNAFQGAAMFAGMVACAWAAGAVQDDRDGNRLEAVVCSGCGPARYLVLRVVGPFAALLAAGVVLGMMVVLCRLAVVGSVDVCSYAAGWALVYLPVVAFGLVFGQGVTLLTGNRSFAVALFAALWTVGVLWGLPAQANAFNVTGEALNQIFFQPVLTAADLPGATDSMARLMADTEGANREWARWNPVFLALGGLLLGAATIAKTAWHWKGDASGLVDDPSRKGGMAFPLPSALLELSAMRAGRVAAVVVAALLLGLLPFLAEDPGGSRCTRHRIACAPLLRVRVRGRFCL